jgi:hypothetical protein
VLKALKQGNTKDERFRPKPTTQVFAETPPQKYFKAGISNILPNNQGFLFLNKNKKGLTKVFSNDCEATTKGLCLNFSFYFNIL